MQVQNLLILNGAVSTTGQWIDISNLVSLSVQINTYSAGSTDIEVSNDPNVMIDGAGIGAPTAAPVLQQFHRCPAVSALTACFRRQSSTPRPHSSRSGARLTIRCIFSYLCHRWQLPLCSGSRSNGSAGSLRDRLQRVRGHRWWWRHLLPSDRTAILSATSHRRHWHSRRHSQSARAGTEYALCDQWSDSYQSARLRNGKRIPADAVGSARF
jgi:hypothetical protein